MNRKELEDRFGSDVAESIVERKLNDEVLKEKETRPWAELPDREEGVLLLTFLVTCLCMRTFGNSLSLTSPRRWKSKKRWSRTCSKQPRVLPPLKGRAQVQACV